MSRPSWSPSIVPHDDHEVYLVLDDLGRLSRIWREGVFENTELETVVHDMLDGQYTNPIGVVAFNPAEGWARDVSGDVAFELYRRCGQDDREIPETIKDFIERHCFDELR